LVEPDGGGLAALFVFVEPIVTVGIVENSTRDIPIRRLKIGRNHQEERKEDDEQGWEFFHDDFIFGGQLKLENGKINKRD
jgi:hypothetical protein